MKTLIKGSNKKLCCIILLVLLVAWAGQVSAQAGSLVLGDANGNGAVDLNDALLIAYYSAHIEVTIDLAAADANQDGVVNIVDAYVTLYIYLGPL